MHTRASFWTLFLSELVNEPQKAFKSAEKSFYPTFRWFWAKLCERKLFFIRSEILGLFDHRVTAKYEYFRSNRENLHLAIEIKLSEKPSNFLRNFSEIFWISIKFAIFSTKKEASSVKYFWSYWLRKMCFFNCITVLFSECPLAVNLLTSLKNSWNLQKSTFILLFHHSQPNWVRKTYFSSVIRF